MATQSCPKCGIGFMDPTGLVLTGNPPAYEHRCTRCGYVDHLREVYTVPEEQAEQPPAEQLPPPNATAAMFPGWVCPRCGGGNAPWATRCPCVPLPYVITARVGTV